MEVVNLGATSMPPSPSLLTPDDLDREAAALFEDVAWRQIVTGAIPVEESAPTEADWRQLLSVPVERLVADALAALPQEVPDERRIPGRIGAALPDRLHAWRRIGQVELRPSVHLGYARLVLTEWGWQNAPYKLRNARGARCVCGALLAAHRLGYGGADTMNEAAAWIMTELRARGWRDLIGPWNRAPGRTAADALALLDAAVRRAAHAGR
ncbi:hypothetical protein [Streptomyces sp. NPDC058872]|uniref:DUF6197 family protein n=1 Tax=Streptomyces sp. NPDC058872 TaxID=3346661 RepID=UPI003680F73B